MDEVPQPTPKVFAIRTTNSVLGSVGSVLFQAAIIGIWLATLVVSIVSRPMLTWIWVAVLVSTIAVITIIVIPRIIRTNRTLARIEVLANKITMFDEGGTQVFVDDLREIAAIYNSRYYYGYRGSYYDYYHVLFRSGQLLTFDQFLENDFTLQKMLKSRMQAGFEELKWSDYEMLEIETHASRAYKAERMIENRSKLAT